MRPGADGPGIRLDPVGPVLFAVLPQERDDLIHEVGEVIDAVGHGLSCPA